MDAGFYGVTYRIGFREAFDIDVNTVVDDICALERQARSIYPGDAEEVVREIRDAATRMTHMHVISLGGILVANGLHVSAACRTIML